MKEIQAGVQIGKTHSKKGKNLHYLLFLPAKYGVDDQESWPLVMFLHGIGERGSSQRTLPSLKRYGPPKIVEQDRDFPCVVVSPQCPSDSYWWEQLDLLESLLEEIVETLHIDNKRIYLTGLSMGGYGTWHFGLRSPDRCAALVPIAGGYIHESREIPETICGLKHVPIWAFHGSADTVVLPYQTEILVEALQACGSSVRYSLLEGADHDQSWERAYANLEMWSWMLSQRKTV
jgi:predicted peptidase